MRRFALIGLVLVATASSAHAVTINTNDTAVYDAFAVGATVQTFESTGLTPLPLELVRQCTQQLDGGTRDGAIGRSDSGSAFP